MYGSERAGRYGRKSRMCSKGVGKKKRVKEGRGGGVRIVS